MAHAIEINLNAPPKTFSPRQRLFAIFVIFVSIQGGILISQALASLYLQAGDVGIIRAVESAIALVVLFASVGAPSLAIRSAAIEVDPAIAAARFRQLLRLAAVIGLGLWVLIIIAQKLFIPGAIPGLVAELAGVAVLSNFVRIAAAHIQGGSAAPQFAFKVALLCAVAVTVQTVATYNYGVNGWVAGRYLGESAVCAGMAFGLRQDILHRGAGAHAAPYATLLRDGVLVNLALLIRLTADNLPILGLTAAKLPTPEIGYFGIALLLMMIPTLAFAVLNQSAYPSIVRSHDQPAERRHVLLRLGRSLLLIAVATFIVLHAVSVLFSAQLPPIYEHAVALSLIIVLGLPCRAIALVLGSFFMASERYRLAVVIGAIEAVVGAILIIPVALKFGTHGAAWLSVGMATTSALAHLVSYFLLVNRS